MVTFRQELKSCKNFGIINAQTLLSVLVVDKNGLFGLINLDGEYVQPCEYLSICFDLFFVQREL